jgi:putative transposase
MKVRKTLKYRLYRNRRNKYLMNRIDVAGIIWNHTIALQRRYYRLTGKYMAQSRMQRHLLKLRRSQRCGFWQKVGSQAVQQIAERHHKAYQRFFDDKAGRTQVKAGRPTFKKVKKYKSFTLKQAGWKLLGDNKIQIQGYTYKFSLSRPVTGDIKTVTIKRDNLGQLWVCFSVIQDVPDPVVISTGNRGGFDFGLKTFLTDSEGNTYHHPQYLKTELNDIARLNRTLSRKVKGSGNWHKSKRRLAKAHRRIANKRTDAHWKLAHELASKFDTLFFEDLNIKGMQKLWGRKVSDLGFSTFLPIQELVCQKTGKQFHKIGRWQRTTGCCARCQYQQALSLSQRVFECGSCGLIIDRDWNAAINICVEGASSTGLGDVRQKLISAVTARPQESPQL